jgi:protein phosphatase
MEIPGLERTIEVEAVAHSDVGRRRSENQDAFLVSDLRDGADPSTTLGQGPSVTSALDVASLGPKGALLAVADGMGGAAEGALASRMALEGFFEAFARLWLPDRIVTPDLFAGNLRRAAEEANGRIFDASRVPEREGMGTTLTVVGVLGAFVHIAHVGDSRAYLLRRGVLTQLTRDQSMVQEMVDSGQMSEEEAGQSLQRSVLLQALGVEPQVSVELGYQALRRADVLLVCSDGLHGVVGDEALGRALSDGARLEATVGDLVASANQLGGPDNITVVAARFSGDGLPLPGNDGAT